MQFRNTPDDGMCIAKSKDVIMSWNLKEAGYPDDRTESDNRIGVMFLKSMVENNLPHS